MWSYTASGRLGEVVVCTSLTIYIGPYHSNCDGEVKKIISYYLYKVMMY